MLSKNLDDALRRSRARERKVHQLDIEIGQCCFDRHCFAGSRRSTLDVDVSNDRAMEPATGANQNKRCFGLDPRAAQR